MTPDLPSTPDTTQACVVPPPSVARWPCRIRRSLAFLFAGVLAHEALESPPPPAPTAIQAPFEELSPAERRYHEHLRATLADVQQRWPHILPPYTIERSGKVVLQASHKRSEPASIRSEQNGETLLLKIDRSGSFVFLQESRTKTQIELWPAQNDLRRTETMPEKTEFLWMTKKESLFGQRSTDGKLKSLFIEGEGTIDPSLPPVILTQKLNSPHRIFLFQRIFATYQDHAFTDGTTFDSPLFVKFFRHFRLSLAEWQKGQYANGSCNTYAETACEVLSASRPEQYPMHSLTYWPSDQKKRFSEPWHQTAAYPMPNGEWCIIDGSMDRLTYVPSPETYGKEWDWELATTPILGRFPWKAEHRGPGFRFLQHIHIPEPRTSP